MNRHDDNAWHLDKKVPLALIFAIFLQTAGAFWWASRTDTRLDTLERRIELSAPAALAVSDRLIRVEEKVGTIKEDIGDIKTMIRRIPLLATPPDRQ